MTALTTRNIRVSVETFYKPEYSRPVEGKFIFAYRVTIENLGTHPVKLLRRHWIISDSTGSVREVKGDGVIGEQPIIEPGASHQYVSWCNFYTELGSMHGTYLMQNLNDHNHFEAEIPRFTLLAPFKLN